MNFKRNTIIKLLSILILVSLVGCSAAKDEEQVIAKTPTVLLSLRQDADDATALKMWNYAKNTVGFNVSTVRESGLNERFRLSCATPATTPDLVYINDKRAGEQFAYSGALLKISDYFDRLPEYTRASAVLDADKRRERMCRMADGALYIAPAFGAERGSDMRAILYRKDIFESSGIELPNTMDELRAALAALKSHYPMSYPMALRGGIAGIDMLAPAWSENASLGAYYDYAENKWKYGIQQDFAGNMVSYFATLAKSKILPPGYLTMSDGNIDSLIAENRVFVIPDNIWRLESLREKHPMQKWDIMPPPRADIASGQNKIANFAHNTAGYLLVNTHDDARLDASLKLLNWMYSDDAEALLSFGIEGETYHSENLDKTFILNKGESAAARYGVGTAGISQRLDVAVYKHIIPKERVLRLEQDSWHSEDDCNPTRWISLKSDEKQELLRINAVYNKSVKQKLMGFLTGTIPMSKWKEFVKSTDTDAAAAALDVFRSAYKRINK
ncbi:MAG: extracellular solute-binding protein [Clostridia bacterium]